MQSSEDFVEEQCRYVYNLTKRINSEEKRFQFVHSHIHILEDCLDDGELKNLLVKRMVSWALQQFKNKFTEHIEMLNLWKLLGKYSKELKMRGVLEKVNELGFFKKVPEFYYLFAETMAAEGNRKEFERAMYLCKENCNMDDYDIKEIFDPLISKYYHDTTMNTMDRENTMQLIKMIATKPFHCDRGAIETVPSLSEESTKRHQNNGVKKVTAVQQCSNEVETIASTINTIQQTTKPNLKPVIPVAEPPSILKQSGNQPKELIVPKEEFSVFCDPTATAIHASIIAPPRQSSAKMDEIDSEPVPLQQVTAAPLAQRRVSFYPDFNADTDETLAGAHAFGASYATSTPRRSIMPGTVPDIGTLSPMRVDACEDEVLIKQPAKQNRRSSLFAVNRWDNAHRRLSCGMGQQQSVSIDSNFVNTQGSTDEQKLNNKGTELTKGVPLLNIGSTIDEESEEKESTQ